MVDAALSEVYPFQKAHISSIIIVTITLPKAFEDFDDIFLVQNADYLPPHKNYNHAINLINSKKFFYGPIYCLSENQLFILQAYIDKNLVNRFIKSSMSPSGALILSVPKFNGGLQLYMNSRDFNILIIKIIIFFFWLASHLIDLAKLNSLQN